MKEKMNKIPVFYACDDNFVKYTMVSLAVDDGSCIQRGTV